MTTDRHCTLMQDRNMPAALEPADRDVDAIGAEIIESAVDQVIAHRCLRFRQPAATAFQFQERHLAARSSASACAGATSGSSRARE
jgi:hypothetical protein